MDIRYIDKDIFEIESDSIVYFTDNSLIGKDSDVLLNKAGNRALESIQKLNGCATGEIKIIPGYNTKQYYIILSVLPNSIDSDKNIYLFKRLFTKLFEVAEEYNINSFAIDVLYMQSRYGAEYIRLLNNIIRSVELKYSDFILYLCKEPTLTNK